jgi:tRNA-specific 2-thiouridylase
VILTGAVTVDLDEAVSGVAAGQTMVLYDGARVIGSATITAASAE